MFVFDAKKRDLLASLPFDQLLGWERSTTGIFVKKRGSTKMTLYASSKLQSQEMVDLLNEYYMMLPQDLRDRLGIIVDNSEELRSRLPDPTTFQSPIARRKPVEYSSRLEHLKYSYIEHCMQPNQDGTTTQPNTKLTHAIDRALDDDKNLEEIDLSFCDPPVDDAQLALICELLNYTIEQVTPQDMQQWRENIDIKKFNIAHERDKQKLSEYCVTNVCNFIRKFTRLTYVNISYVPLDNRNESDIVKALNQLPDLETLVLRGCKIGNKGFAHIVEVFSMIPSKLKTLDLEHNALTHVSMAQLCSYMDNDNCVLNNLNVGFNQIEVQGLETLLATLKRTEGLSVFDFSSNPGGRGAPAKFAELVAASVGITDLNISSNGLTGEAGVRIAGELKSKTQIKKINFSDNPIGPTLTRQRQAGSGEITRDYPAEFFSFLDVGVTCVLQQLVMDRCDLHEDAGQALASVLQNNSKLTDLVLSNNRLASVKTGLLPTSWTDMIMNNSYLCKLILSYNGISYLGVMKLFAAMTKNKSIQELVLDGNPLDRYPPNTAHSEVVAMLQFNLSLRKLSMRNCNVKNDFLIKIGEGLAKQASHGLSSKFGLKSLNLEDNEIDARGATEFALAIQDNDVLLEFLNLSCRAIQVNNELYMQCYRVLIERTNCETIIV
jgi:Ran GTPase-activating protein (RanGAP) involved in mRNA processing and transport